MKQIERFEKVEYEDKQRRWESARREEKVQREARRKHLELR